MKKEIWFDMDGTIADLYGVENWLEMLIAEDPTPYAVAKPPTLARKLNALQAQGYKIGIVSWLSKGSTPQYDEAVRKAKIKWLRTHLKSVRFDTIDIITYGEPKQNGRNGILFDDEAKNRENWNGFAADETMVFEVLKTL